MVRDAIVSKIRSEIGGGDDDEVLQMKPVEFSDKMKQDLLKLGPVMDLVDEDKKDQILDLMNQDDTTVGTLINQIVGGSEEEPSFTPETNPATMPQQFQNFPTGTGLS